MANQMISFDLRTDKGEDISVMQELIEKRKQELGETSLDACVALTINILKSLRSQTKVANPKEKVDLRITDVTAQFYPSWKRVGKKSWRILRSCKDGNEIHPKQVKWICQRYFKGQILYSYKVVDVVSDDKQYEYLLVADNQKMAEDYAKRKHEKRIAQSKGLAKYALGLAMHRVSERENPQDDIKQQARRTGMNNTKVYVQSSGFDNGDVSVHVEDNLRYATMALKSQNGVDMAVQNALAKMVGYINHRLHEKGIYDKDIRIKKEELTNI